MTDLIRPDLEEKDRMTPEEARRMIEDLAWQHKKKFWGKIGDKYIKKEE